MSWERLRPGMVASRQRRALAEFVDREVVPFSPLYAGRLDGSDGLSTLPPTELGEVDPADAVLRPTRSAITESRWRWKWFTQGVLGRRAAFAANTLEPLYRPIHWDGNGTFAIGSSSADLDLLAELGRRWLEHAGVGVSDLVVDVHPSPGAGAFWQLALGCRHAGVQAVHAGDDTDPARVAALRPTVLAGPASVVHRLLAADPNPGGRLETVLLTGDRPPGPERAKLRGLLADDVALLAAWAPAGVRALWAECRELGALHTWPDAELVEVVDPLTHVTAPAGAEGELLWSAIGWRGTVLLRLRTGLLGRVHTDRCPGCGRTSPRIELAAPDPVFARVLDAEAGIAAWQAELRIVGGGEELIVFVAPRSRDGLVEMLDALDEQIGVTQFVVLPPKALARRLQEHDGARVVDSRS